jgi:hypothetical protein
LPSFLPATSASLVLTTQNVTSTAPLVVTASNGSNDAGDVNRVGQTITNSLSWTVGASVTSYLPATVNADGTLTAVTPVTLAPIYQHGGTPATTSGQYTYNLQEGKMYKGNGATAPQVNDVIVGEAVSGASTITSTIAYAVRGCYTSANVTIPASNTQVTNSHNIGNSMLDWIAKLVCTTAELGYSVGDEIDLNSVSANTPFWQIFQTSCSRLQFSTIWQSGGGALNVKHKTTAAITNITIGSWRIVFSAKKK